MTNYPAAYCTRQTAPVKVTDRRFALSIQPSSPQAAESLFVLMKAPGQANAEVSDQTVNRVLTKIGDQYRQVVLVCVTPVVVPGGQSLQDYSGKIERLAWANNQAVIAAMSATTPFDLLVATGDLTATPALAAPYVQLMTTINQHFGQKRQYVLGLSGDGYGTSPSRLNSGEFYLKSAVQADAQWHLRLV